MKNQLSPFTDQSSLNFDSIFSSYPSKISPTSTELTFVEYFAGIGLVRLGLEQAGWNPVFANDFNQMKKDMYVSHFQDTNDPYSTNDIFNLEPNEIPNALLATASFPCIDLSLAGYQNGLSGKHSSAFWGLIQILREQEDSKPSIIMLENVPGWLTTNKGEDFRLTIKSLNNLGYTCDVFSIDALHFTPQSRRRIFAIGMVRERPNNAYERFKSRPASLANKALKRVVDANQDLSWDFLPISASLPKSSEGLSQIIEEIDNDDKRWWSSEEVERHLSMMDPKHYERVEILSQRSRISYRTIYRRKRDGKQRAEVRAGDTAGCLRTARGGSSRQIVLAAGDGSIKMRHMTPREYARLQGVPEEYPIPENTIQALNGFGEAVCVPVITWIGEQILNPLAYAINRL